MFGNSLISAKRKKSKLEHFYRITWLNLLAISSFARGLWWKHEPKKYNNTDEVQKLESIYEHQKITKFTAW